MLLLKAMGKGKKAVNKAVSSNIKKLSNSATKRPLKQIIAIAESAARKRKKK